MSDLNNQIEDLIEHKKLVIKLEEALKQKDFENSKLIKVNKDLKDFCEELKSELNQEKIKIISQYSEIKNIIKKYEHQIESLNSEHEKQIQKYDEKIYKLSSYNPQILPEQIKSELESKYNNILKNKDLQILNLNNEIKELTENISLNKTELDLLKKNLNYQLETERDTHSFQMKDLLSKINNQNELDKSNEEKTIFEELKLTIQHNDEKNEILYKELENLRIEKNSNEISLNKKIFELETQVKEEKNNNNILNSEIENMQEDFNNIKRGILQKEMELNQIQIENQKLIEKNNNLKKIIEEKTESDDKMREDLNILRKKIMQFSNENNLKNEENNKLKKQILELEQKYNNNIMDEKMEKQKNDNLNYGGSYRAPEESINLFKEEYEKIREKYNNILKEQKMKNEMIINKDEEIKYLNNFLKKISKNSKDAKYNFEDLYKKYKEISQKKAYYKNQCKNANINMMKILNILTSKQKQDLENDGFNLLDINKVNEYMSESSKEM